LIYSVFSARTLLVDPRRFIISLWLFAVWQLALYEYVSYTVHTNGI